MSTQNIVSTLAPQSLGLSSLVARFNSWRRRRAAYADTFSELSRLSDRDLADLRLSRADFHYLASQAAAKVA